MLVGTASKDAGVAYQPFAEMLDHLFLTSEPGTLEPPASSACCPGTPPATSRTPPSPPATAATTCSRRSRRCSGRSPATGRWSSSSTTCTGHSCRPSRCWSTWSTPAWAAPCSCSARSGPPRRTGRTSSAPGSPTCTGSTACAASTWPGSTPTPSPSSWASTPACPRPRRGRPRRSCATGPAATRSSCGRPGSTWNGTAASPPCAARNGCRPPSATPWPRGWPASTSGCGRPSTWPR